MVPFGPDAGMLLEAVMDGIEPRKRPRRRVGLRGLMVLVALIALVLFATLPLFSEKLRYIEEPLETPPPMPCPMAAERQKQIFAAHRRNARLE